MARLLYIESSPRKERSKSIEVSKAFIESYKAEHPSDEVVTLDLWEKELPAFDGYTIDAKYQVLHGQGFDANQKAAWQAVVDVCDEFKSADKYLINFSSFRFSVKYQPAKQANGPNRRGSNRTY